jgi:tetratricopeptide (TPR) repeat protein
VARRPEAVPVSPASGRPTVPVSTPPAGRGDAPRGVPAQRADKPVVGADPGRSAGARSAEDEPTVRQAAAPLRQAAQAFGPDGRDPEAYAPPQPGTDSSRRGADGPGHRSGSIAVPAPRPPADPARAGAGQPPAAPQAPADRSARHGAAGAPTPARHGTASDPAAATRHGINDDPTVATRRGTTDPAAATRRGTTDPAAATRRGTTDPAAATRRGTAEPAAGDDPTVASPLPQRTARHGTAADPAAPADRPARHGTPEDPAAAQDGYGAHAQPYMDADGTLHNLRPIGRLVVSGPDQPAARPADTEFGGKWFAPKPEDEAAADPGSGTADGGPEGRRDGLADDRTDGLAQDRANGFAEDRTNGFSEDRTDGFSGDRADGFSGDRADERHDDGAVAEFAPASGGSDGLVIDLDLTGLLNGMAITAEEGEPVGSPQPEPAETDAARRSLIPGPEPKLDQRAAERKPPDRTLTLSAADLEAIRWRLDGGTLREVVDDREALRELGERLDGPLSDETDNVAKASLLSVRAEVYRLLGELGMAAAASRLALAHAESSRNTQSLVIAEAELAHVLRLRGDFQEADRLFAKATAAPAPDALLSVVHENAGRCCFDQGRHMEALDHFARAVRLGHPEDQELAERVGVCLEAVYIHVLRDGWGPYPRDSYELLGTERPPGVPAPAGGTFPGPVAERLAI